MENISEKINLKLFIILFFNINVNLIIIFHNIATLYDRCWHIG